MSALHLQSLFTDEPGDRTAWLRYGLVSDEAARRVAQDLLDVLLAAEASRPDYSLLSEFATRLKMPLALRDISVIPRQARTVRIRQVKTLEARIFAMAMTDNLMFASARIDALQLHQKTDDARSMRTHWMWPHIPQESLNLLIDRIKNWPNVYIKTCWPGLDNIENAPMLQRRKRLIVQSLNRNNMHTRHRPLANYSRKLADYSSFDSITNKRSDMLAQIFRILGRHAHAGSPGGGRSSRPTQIPGVQ